VNNPKRQANERKFEQWSNLDAGGRRYWYDIPGRSGWMARYVKEVDENEVTTRFYQEIYDDGGQLVEIHEKFPRDKGHETV